MHQSTLPGLDGDKVPCVQCDRREYGLSWGDYCSLCREERQLKAEAKAKRVAAGAAIVMAAYLFLTIPPLLSQRVFAAVSVVLVYFIVRRVVSRLAFEYLPKEPRNRSVEAQP